MSQCELKVLNELIVTSWPTVQLILNILQLSILIFVVSTEFGQTIFPSPNLTSSPIITD